MTRRPSRLVGCAAVALAVAACGKSGAPSTTPTERPSGEGPSQSAVRIVTPRAGSTVRAVRRPSGKLSASVTVTGRADALQTVRVDGSCAESSCTKFVYTGAQGGFTAKLRLRLPAHSRRLTVKADYSVTPGTATGAQVSLAIDAVRPPRQPQRTSAEQTPTQPTTTDEQPQSTATSPTTSSTPTPTPTPSPGPRTLVLVGDSLAVGVRTLLPAALPGWSVQVLGRVGRPLAEGVGVIDGLNLQAQSAAARPVLAVSLFTNDDPTHTAALQAAVRRTLQAVGPDGCVIWATVARPPVNGVTYQSANALLTRLAAEDPRLIVVPWAERVAATNGLLGADGVHPTSAGYELRAQLYAQAAQACR
jgi:hypothetical protein